MALATRAWNEALVNGLNLVTDTTDPYGWRQNTAGAGEIEGLESMSSNDQYDAGGDSLETR